MGRKALDRFRYVTRWVFLLAVLSGIFFSNGEGVRLLPFPDSSPDGEKIPVFFQTQPAKSYIFSVHKFGSFSLSHKNKVQKNFKTDFICCSLLSDADISDEAFLDFSAEKIRDKRKVFYDSAFLISTQNRAPPVRL
jgi:hypothetical protein